MKKALSVLILGTLTGCLGVNVTDLDPSKFGGSATLAVCTGVDFTYSTQIVPIFENRTCTNTGCHGGGTTSGNLNLDLDDQTAPDDATGIHETLLDGRVDTSNPDQSTILQKPLGIPSHTGGKIFTDENDTDYVKLLCWIGAGAENDLVIATTASCAFTNDVYPIFANRGCSGSGCHDQQIAGGNMNLNQGAPEVYDAVVNGGRVDKATPQGSLILKKPSGLPSHDGGKIFRSTSDQDYKTLLCWIQEGAQNN